MKNKLPIAIASLLSIPAALAAPAPLTFFKDLVENNLGFIFVNFSESTSSIFWLRVMIWLLLFAAFYAVLTGAVKDFSNKKNISVTISMILALISAIFIPNTVLISIGKSYGITVSFLLMGLPIAGALYLLIKVFPTDKKVEISKRRLNHAIKAILYYLLFTLLGNYISALGRDAIFSGNGAVTSWGSVIQSFVLIAMIYHLFAAIFASAPSEGGEESWLEKLLKGKKKEEESTPEAKKKEEADLSAMEQKLSALNIYVNKNNERSGFGDRVEEFNQAVNEYVQGKKAGKTADEMKDLKDAVIAQAEEARKSGETVEGSFVDILSDPNFAKLKERHCVMLENIIGNYQFLIEQMIGHMNDFIANT